MLIANNIDRGILLLGSSLILMLLLFIVIKAYVSIDNALYLVLAEIIAGIVPISLDIAFKYNCTLVYCALSILVLILYTLLKSIKTIAVEVRKGIIGSDDTVFINMENLKQEYLNLQSDLRQLIYDEDCIFQQMSNYRSIICNIGTVHQMNCSLQIVKSARDNPITYIIKYTGIDDRSIKYLNTLIENNNKILSIKQKQYYTITQLNTMMLGVTGLIKAIKARIAYRKFIYKCFYEINIVEYQVFRFKYTSAKGRSFLQYDYIFNNINIQYIVNKLHEDSRMEARVKKARSAMTSKLREYIKRRDNYTCQICGRSKYRYPDLEFEIDHIFPVSLGGRTEESNLQLLCKDCNRKKGAKVV